MSTVSVRIDKWLWAARFFKTRSLATHAIDQGRVRIGDLRVKPSRSVHVGERLRIEVGEQVFMVEVVSLSDVRGSATIARELYQETPDSLQARMNAADRRRLSIEPAKTIEGGRPTKHYRRQLDSFRGR